MLARKFRALRLLGLAVAGIGVLTPLPAGAAAYILPGALPSGCSGAGTSYTCPSLSLAWGDTLEVVNANTTLTVSSTFSNGGGSINWTARRAGFRLQAATVNGNNYLNFHGALAATGALTLGSNTNQIIGSVSSGTAMSLGGAVTGTVTAGGQLTTQWNTVISGAVSVGSLTSGGGSTYGSSVTASSGVVVLKSGDVVTGAVTASGAVTTEWGGNIGGDIVAGSFVGGGGGTYGGKITTGSGKVELGVSDTVAGNVTSAGLVKMEHASRVRGSVSAGTTVQLLSSDATVDKCILVPKSGNSKVMTLGWHAHVGSVCCRPGGSPGCQDACVKNDSGYAMPPTSSDVAACMATASVDHYEVDIPTTGLTCQASSLAVRACADGAAPCLSSLATVSASTTLSASSGSFTSGGGAVQTFTGSTTYTHSLTSAGAVTIGLASASPTAPMTCYSYDGSSRTLLGSCGFNVVESAFLYSVPNFGAGAGSGSVTISAVRQDDNTKKCVSFVPSGGVKMWTGYVNPASGSKAASLDYSGTAYPLPTSEPASGNVPLAFNASGQAAFSLNYWDAGQMRLYAKWNSATGQDDFVVKPYFTVSGLQCADGTNNPGASGATDEKFCRAGQPFSATVTAVASDGTTTTPNFGSEVPVESVSLSAALVSPAGGAEPALAGSLAKVAGTPSVASSSTLSWPEVGIISLTPGIADGSYLGAGGVASFPVALVGRFFPSHFATTVTPPMGCPAGATCPASGGTPANGMAYAGQTFVVTVKALRFNGTAVTENYDKDRKDAGGNRYSHGVALAPHASLGGIAPAGRAAGALSGASVAADAFVLGVASASATSYAFTTAPGEMTDVYIGAAEAAGGDSVSSVRSPVSSSVEGALKIAQGRIALANAFGNGRSPLDVSVSAQYWSGRSWLVNDVDATLLSVAAVATKPSIVVSSLNPQGAGRWAIRLAAPASAGSFDIGLNLGDTTLDSCIAGLSGGTAAGVKWLRSRNGNCSANYDKDPVAKATFGIYAPETQKLIHVREQY